jgi:hypothetical protein
MFDFYQYKNNKKQEEGGESMKKIRVAFILGISLVALVAFLAWAGEGEKEFSKEDLKAEFSKCHVCGKMIPYMDNDWWWQTNHEIYDLENGMVFIHSITDKKYAGDFHKMCGDMEAAIGELKAMPEDKLQGKMCQHCQDFAALTKAGARYESVLTETGSLGIVTSEKPELVKRIHAMAEQSRQMFAK